MLASTSATLFFILLFHALFGWGLFPQTNGKAPLFLILLL